MEVAGDYRENGYAHLRGLIPPEVAHAFLQGLKADMGPAPVPVSRIQEHASMLKRPAFEVYGHHYKPMLFFLWGLTPIVSELAGVALLPTYDYFRLYRRGDVCRVHSDRYSCEHSLSLTLDYSDDAVWDFQIGTDKIEPSARVEDDFGSEPYSTIRMNAGDAILYRGVEHRHGRVEPNPNGWSAHLFLHWVDRDGPYRDHAFDGQIKPAKSSFSFA